MDFLSELGIQDSNSAAFCGTWMPGEGAPFDSFSPVHGKRIATVRAASRSELETITSKAHEAFLRWREVPAPRRGEYVRRMGEVLRAKKEPLGRLVSFEVGKILEEG
ncbi:MAG: aldehyde dehydrogenase family protein, partial [Planctomycetes bacterium]|nr:aldehyde dehydrogenase family protein [Planctomycetota bacterium]